MVNYMSTPNGEYFGVVPQRERGLAHRASVWPDWRLGLTMGCDRGEQMIKGMNARRRLGFAAFLLPLMSVSGCAGLADGMSRFAGVGVVSQEVAAFDGARVVSVTPSFLLSENGFGSMTKMGAHWTSNDKNNVALILSYSSSISGGAAYINISGMDVNMGGKITKLRAGGTTDHDSAAYNTVMKTIYTKSENMVLVPLSFLEEMVASSDCRLRLYTSKGYEDIFFSNDRIPGGQGTARLALKEFLLAVNDRTKDGA